MAIVCCRSRRLRTAAWRTRLNDESTQRLKTTVLPAGEIRPAASEQRHVRETELTIRDHRASAHSREHVEAQAWQGLGAEFVLIPEVKPPPRIALARERMLLCRLYLGLIRSINDDYGAAFASHSDSSSLRAIGIYVFLRTVMCAPVHASTIARALKLPRVTVLRRLQEMVKHGYVERVGNAYRITDKVNIPDLEDRLQRRVAMITDTANKLAELSASARPP
jgi:hypothetical protein